MELSLLKILNRHCIRSSSQVQKNNCSSTRLGRGNLATDNEKFPVGVWTVLEPRMSQHSRCGFPDALGLYSCQIPSVSNKGPEGPVFICLTCAYTHLLCASKWAQSLEPLSTPSPMGRGLSHVTGEQGRIIHHSGDISFAKLWRAIMRKNGNTWPVGSKRANLELRGKIWARKREKNPNKIFKCSSYGVRQPGFESPLSCYPSVCQLPCL